MLISNAAIRNRTTIMVMIILIIFAGAYSYATLPREAAPDVPIPLVLVTTIYEGVSPEDVESSVTREIEQKLTGLKGVKEIRSTSSEGISTVVIEFLPDIIIDDAMQYVRDKVDQAKPELPEDAEEPSIQEINIAEFPIMMINISGSISPVRLKAIADELEDAIEEVPGVLGCDVLGALEREIRLEIDQDRLAMFGLTMIELMKIVPAENVNISAGGLDTPGMKFNVRISGEFADPAELKGLLLAIHNGKPIYLPDVARVRDTFKDRTTYARLDEAETITLAVKKRIGANVVDIAKGVKRILAAAQKMLPVGARLDITDDRSKDIDMMVKDLENNVLSGLVLVVAVLMIFMGVRTSMIVAAAIPMSMLISFAVLQALGFTLNMIVLFSLIMALGMLVDNAIVIVENIYRYRQLGYGRIEAAMKGTGEVAWPVITSTATTVAAFSPLMFWPGIMGDFMKYLPITLIITLTSSLFVAMVINPTVCAVVGGKTRKTAGPHRITESYRRLLEAALRHRGRTLMSAVGLLVIVVVLYRLFGSGVELFPQMDPRRAVVNIRSPQGTNIDESNRLAALVERRVRPFGAELQHVITNVGSSGGAGALFGGGSSGPHIANITLLFHDFEERKRPSADVVLEIREALADIPGAEIKVEREKHGPPTGAAVTVRISGEDLKTLERLSEEAKKLIVSTPGLVNLRSDLEAARPELAFRVDRRRAMLLGVNTSVIGNFLKTAVFGREVGTYRQFNDEYDITLRLPLSQRINLEDIMRLRIPNDAGRSVPLSSLGRFEYSAGFGTINRVDQDRVVTLTGDAEGRLGPAVLKDVQAKLATLDTPRGYDIRYVGEKEEQDKAMAFLSKAFVIALLIIVMILVTQFNTLSVPFIIMTTVALSMMGVLSGLLICRMPFGVIMTGVGVISLAGVVVNNAIVLLDYTRQLQRSGMELTAAAVEAGVTRLRPVFMTAVTTILGLIPMATGVSFDFHKFAFSARSESSQWWASMAVVVIFGLALATMLTLVVVPALYVSLYRIAARHGLGGLRKHAPQTETDRPHIEQEDF